MKTPKSHENDSSDAADEELRRKLLQCVSTLRGAWRSVTVLSSGCVSIRFKDGSDRVILPAEATTRSQGGTDQSVRSVHGVPRWSEDVSSCAE